MGMGYAGSMAIVVETDYVKNTALKEYEALMSKLDELEVDFDSFAYAYVFDDFEVIEKEASSSDDETGLSVLEEELRQLTEALLSKFEEETGLGIDINYHNSEDTGSRYDEVSGGFFDLNFHDVYQLTEEAKAHKMAFEFKHFVSFG